MDARHGHARAAALADAAVEVLRGDDALDARVLVGFREDVTETFYSLSRSNCTAPARLLYFAEQLVQRAIKSAAQGICDCQKCRAAGERARAALAAIKVEQSPSPPTACAAEPGHG